MGNKGRWQEPSDREGRDEYRELRRELKLSRTSKARRAEIEARLDEISPTGGTKEPSLEKREPKPTTADNLALCARVEAARKTAEVSWPVFVPDAAAYRERALLKVAKATPAEKAAAILSDLPEHPLNKLARELAHWLWNEDRSNPKPPLETLTEQRVRHWLSRAPYNLHDIRGNKETVANAVNDALRLVAERDAAEPGWFVRRAEKLLDAPSAPSKPPAAQSRQTAERARPSSAQPEPSLNATEQAGADSAQRVNLILQVDPHLRRLAGHSTAYDSAIRAAIADRLQTHGNCDGGFLAGLYNAVRPKNVGAFPPRQF